MHILIVDDMPEFKVQKAIEYLKSQNLDFTYEIAKSANSAGRYIAKHLKKEM